MYNDTLIYNIIIYTRAMDRCFLEEKRYLTGVTVVVLGGGPVLGVLFFVFFLGGRFEEFPVI